MLPTGWKIFGRGVVPPSHIGTNQRRARGQPDRQQVNISIKLKKVNVTIVRSREATLFRIPSTPKGTTIINVLYFGGRATLLTILSKLLEGSVPRVLILHMPEIIDAITGWWGSLGLTFIAYTTSIHNLQHSSVAQHPSFVAYVKHFHVQSYKQHRIVICVYIHPVGDLLNNILNHPLKSGEI